MPGRSAPGYWWLTMIPIEPTDLPEPPAWLTIEKRIAELLDSGPVPTDPEDQRLPEYRSLLDALDRLEWEAGMQYRKENRTA